ncbi:hypothetical protein L226DRAFT_6586 [Lentinus tigrinus ALCF2SS1-7]|uniref:uncharacterized protein n=1 Tax=Lentinus tigrinus ALCF2SS1-7 TaxID=1328758 RepID=UPI0011663B6F|nr:hypothetical protein L226DRAFT_6586 [Lentinus tigrinus ALCF2SS1-7]
MCHRRDLILDSRLHLPQRSQRRRRSRRPLVGRIPETPATPPVRSRALAEGLRLHLWYSTNHALPKTSRIPKATEPRTIAPDSRAFSCSCNFPAGTCPRFLFALANALRAIDMNLHECMTNSAPAYLCRSHLCSPCVPLSASAFSLRPRPTMTYPARLPFGITSQLRPRRTFCLVAFTSVSQSIRSQHMYSSTTIPSHITASPVRNITSRLPSPPRDFSMPYILRPYRKHDMPPLSRPTPRATIQVACPPPNAPPPRRHPAYFNIKFSLSATSLITSPNNATLLAPVRPRRSF